MGGSGFDARLKQKLEEYQWPVAIVREMIEELGEEKALELASRALTKLQQDHGRELAQKYGATFEGFVRFQRETAEQSETKSILEEGENFVRIRLSRCTAWEALSTLGLPQLCRVYCDTDPAFARAFSPKLKLKAVRRLSDGDDCCEYIWSWED